MKIITGIFLFLCLGVSSAYSETIKIAILSEKANSDLDAPAYLKDIPSACQAALNEKKAALLKKGLKVELVIKQFKPTPLAPYQTLEQVYNSDAIAAVGFQSSDEVMSAAPVIKNTNFLAVSPYATASKVFTLQPNYLTLSPNDEEAARYIERFIVSQLHPHKIIAIVAWDSAFSKNFYESLDESFKKQVKLYKVFDDLKDFKKTALAIKSDNPDVIFLPNFPVNAASVIRTLSNMGMNSTYIGASSWSDPNDNRFSTILNGVHFNAYVIKQFSLMHMTQKQKMFAEELKKKYNADYSVTAGLYHDATLYLLDLILEGPQNISRDTLLKASEKKREIDGVMGLNCLSSSQCKDREFMLLKLDETGFTYEKSFKE